MIDWISKNRDKKRRETHEQELRNSLAEKVSLYEKSLGDSANGPNEQDFTELFIDGKKLRVVKEEITVTDI